DPLGSVYGPVASAALNIQAVVLYLDIKILAESLMKPLGQFRGLVQLFLENELADLARGTAGQADDALPVLGQEFLVDAWHVVVAFEKRDGGHLDEVFEAGEILG